MINKRELVKKCIEQTAEIARFLIEANKRPKILEELPEEELIELREKFSFLYADFHRLTLSNRRQFTILQREKEAERLKLIKRSAKNGNNNI